VNRLALTLVPLLLVSCGGGSTDTSPAVATTGSAAAQTLTVDMTDQLRFTPASITAQVGTVTFTVSNTGLVPHDLAFADAALGRTKTVDGKAAAVLTVAFAKAGTYRFRCTFHPGMTGKVTVS
jgi:plastocyanin